MNSATTASTVGTFSKAVPTKFLQPETDILTEAKKATGFSKSELIRRAVRLLGRHKAVEQRYDFLLQLTA